ncbi:uncharacterized protein LOC112557389 [Pomacea canaliculata]|uniref:uncharacterized protein LOC112557389 n=1 Tax=Pomacea canaliculata TaxID=400727 RepID=UPI000D73E4F3|nr:uncharacterized protein LOC112557389 [Pomacea canaliculata]
MSDIEDLAAQVGIEILPSSTSGQLIASKTAQSADGDRSSAENKELVESHQIFSKEILSRCTEERLAELDAVFKHRFTEEDEEYARTLSTPKHPPPCVTDWGSGNRNPDRSRDHHDGYNNWRRGSYRGHNSPYRSHGYHQNRQDHYRDNRDNRWGHQLHPSDGGKWQQRERSPYRRN